MTAPAVPVQPTGKNSVSAASKTLPLTDLVLESLAITKRGVDELLIESEFENRLGCRVNEVKVGHP